MNVRELIEALKVYPSDMDVVIAEAGGDEYVPVVQVIQEDGTSVVTLLDRVEVVYTVHQYGSCGGMCDLCGDQP